MKNKSFKIVGWFFIIIGAYGILNLFYKLLANQSNFINGSDVLGIFFLIAGIILIYRFKRINKVN